MTVGPPGAGRGCRQMASIAVRLCAGGVVIDPHPHRLRRTAHLGGAGLFRHGDLRPWPRACDADLVLSATAATGTVSDGRQRGAGLPSRRAGRCSPVPAVPLANRAGVRTEASRSSTSLRCGATAVTTSDRETIDLARASFADEVPPLRRPVAGTHCSAHHALRGGATIVPQSSTAPPPAGHLTATSAPVEPAPVGSVPSSP